MATLLIVLAFIALILLCGFMVLVILMQKASQGAGLGGAVGGGAAESAFGGEASSVLTKVTIYCAILFFLGSMGLSLLILYRHSNEDGSAISDELKRLEHLGDSQTTGEPPVAEEGVEDAVQQATEAAVTESEAAIEAVEEKAEAVAEEAKQAVKQAEENVQEAVETAPAELEVNAENLPVPGK